jgi:pyruvate formate lyase activating enzyme
MSKGMIFNIEEFAIHDGPGIRKLVFFKGCPLSCTWCHNPEGISFERELMVSYTSCIHCEKCKKVCTHNDDTVCENCDTSCQLRLRKIAGTEYEADVLAEKLKKSQEVLIGSGGGITISGGEPLAQPKFFFELVSLLKPLHVAVETSGFAKSSIFQKMVKEVDLVLMDVKHSDTLIHKKFTGVYNTQILKNLDFLTQAETDFIVRIPLIPGVNDTKKNMEQTALLVKDAIHLVKVELLPFHQTAGAKYSMVRREYNPGFDTIKKVNIWREVFEKYNIDVNVL